MEQEKQPEEIAETEAIEPEIKASEDQIKPKKDWKQIAKSVFFSYLWLAVLLIIVDQCSKWGVYHLLGGVEGTRIDIIPGFLQFSLHFNKGMSYGALSDSDGWRIVLCIVSWVASAAIIYFWVKNLKKNDRWINAVAALILAGALGNGIDRAFYWQSIVGFDGVIDFIIIYFFGPNNAPPFGVFNIADACLSIGVVMFIIIYIVRAIKEAKKEKKK